MVVNEILFKEILSEYSNSIEEAYLDFKTTEDNLIFKGYKDKNEKEYIQYYSNINFIKQSKSTDPELKVPERNPLHRVLNSHTIFLKKRIESEKYFVIPLKSIIYRAIDKKFNLFNNEKEYDKSKNTWLLSMRGFYSPRFTPEQIELLNKFGNLFENKFDISRNVDLCALLVKKNIERLFDIDYIEESKYRAGRLMVRGELIERLFYQYHNQLSQSPRYNIFLNNAFDGTILDGKPSLRRGFMVNSYEKQTGKDYYCGICCLNVYHIKEYGQEDIGEPCFFCST